MKNRIHLCGQICLVLSLAVVTVLCLSLPALAVGNYDCEAVSLGRLDNLQTRPDLVNFVRCAEQHIVEVGWTQALDDFHNDSTWIDGGMYLFAVDTEGFLIFNASGTTQPGDEQDHIDQRDIDGKAMRRRFVYTAGSFGSGFVTYRFLDPATDEIAPKVVYVTSVRQPYGDRTAILAAGYYPRVAPGTCSPHLIRADLVFTRSDAEQFVRCAALEIKQRGLVVLHELRTSERWRSGPVYLFIGDQETGISVLHGANPSLEGQNLGDYVDSSGFAYVREMRDIVQIYGDGYTYYEFTNPVTGAKEPKFSYVKNLTIDGFDYVIGAGLYVPSDIRCLDMPNAGDLDTEDELELFVNCAADLVASRGTESFNLLRKHQAWNDGSTYIFVLEQEECRSILYPLDYRADELDCSLVDTEGTLINQNIVDIAKSETGRGYTSYIWLNPASDQVERKTSYVVGVELDGDIFAVGAGIYGLE